MLQLQKGGDNMRNGVLPKISSENLTTIKDLVTTILYVILLLSVVVSITVYIVGLDNKISILTDDVKEIKYTLKDIKEALDKLPKSILLGKPPAVCFGQ